LTGGNGGCDGVIEQTALPQKRRLSSLGNLCDQSVQQGAHPSDDLVLPGAEGPYLAEGELLERYRCAARAPGTGLHSPEP
jgi:hypothetical protein